MNEKRATQKRSLLQHRIVRVVRRHGGSADDELFLISLTLNVNTATLPANPGTAARQLCEATIRIKRTLK